MNQVSHHQLNKYWPGVEQFFSNLPPRLFKQGVLLKNNLATHYADTGQFKDILTRNHDHPMLSLPFWLLDDFGIANTPERENIEKHLFSTTVFAFAAVYTQENILDEGTNFDNSYLFLAQRLTQQADTHLVHIFPGPSIFWTHHKTFWQEYAEASLVESQTYHHPQSVHHSKLAFTKVPVAAAAIYAGKYAALPQLCTLMDNLNFIFGIMKDISTIRLDLTRRRYTYPIIAAMHKAGIDPNQPLEPARILGALVLTDVIPTIEQDCLSRLETCREISVALNLPTFTAYWPAVEVQITEITSLFSIKSKPAKPKPKRPIFAPAIDTLPKVIEMAEGYLLSDPTFKESWEVQRRGIFGESEITGKAFPAGLITEILARHGHNIPASIDMVFETLQATGFRYYDHDHLPPDTDDLGLLLRLYPYSAQPELHREILQAPLQWLENSICDSGEIPVWLMQNTGPEKTDQQFVSLWGKSCAAVEANVLLGLMDYDWTRYQGLIEKSALKLFDRLGEQGLGATLHYVPLYSMWVMFELIARLETKPVPTDLQNKLKQASQILFDHLAVETNQPDLSPQDAAFLTLICYTAELPDSAKSLVKPERWLTVLAKTQRYDGSWAGEPLFGTPTRGELATWYGSRSVTTAFCYHALKTHLRQTRKIINPV